MRYRPEIDGLRAVAVIPVILFHAGFEAFSGGFVGVDIFFVISGYLITTIINGEITSGTFTIAKFYERRARRILPAILTVGIACIPFAWMWILPTDFKDFSQSLVAVATFSSNILFWLESGYFEATAELKPLLHTWSLSVEEQFYLFFPLLLLLIRGVGIQKKIAVVAVITLSSLIAAVYGSGTYPSATFYLIPTRAWELGAGALLAMSACVDKKIPHALREGIAAFGAALIVYSVFAFDESTPFPSLYTVVPVLGTALVIAAATGSTAVGRALGLSAFVGIGLISYSLYLWHQPILAFIRLRSLYEPSSWVMTGAIAFALLLSVVTWKYVETPFRRGNRISRSALVRFSISGSALMLSVGLLGTLTNGFSRLNEERSAASTLQDKVRINHGLSDICENRFTLATECRTHNQPEVIVWGDSYAMHLVDGILAKVPDVKLIQMTKSVCGPILDLAPVTAKFPREWALGCLEFNREVFAWLARQKSVKVAVVSSPFFQYLDPRNRYLTDAGMSDVDSRVAVKAFLDTLDKLESIGVTPIVISPPPAMGMDIGRCLVKAAYFDVDSSICDFSRVQADRYRPSVVEYLKLVERRHRVIWLDQTMCDSRTCRTAAGDLFLYRDEEHLSHEGSRNIGESFEFLTDLLAPTVRK